MTNKTVILALIILFSIALMIPVSAIFTIDTDFAANASNQTYPCNRWYCIGPYLFNSETSYSDLYINDNQGQTTSQLNTFILTDTGSSCWGNTTKHHVIRGCNTTDASSDCDSNFFKEETIAGGGLVIPGNTNYYGGQYGAYQYAYTGNKEYLVSTIDHCQSGNTTVVLWYMSVHRAPVAAFTATPLTGPAPLTVNFTDTSTGSPASWSWVFGDGQTSTVQNVTHTYGAAGTYDVRLTAANAGGSNMTVKAGYVVVTAPEPEVYTFSITNVFDPPGTDPNKTLGLFTTQNVIRWLGDKAGWKLLFNKSWANVTKADFGTDGGGLDNATLHWHVGHGAIPDIKNYSALGLQDFSGSFLYPTDVEKKWGIKNKWIVLHACYALSDERWGQALTTSHGIFGFTTPVYINPVLPSEFFHNAMDKNMTLFDSCRRATKNVFGGSTKVPSKFFIDANGDLVGDYVNDTIPISAGARFKTIEQFNNDHLPGYGTVEPDGNPNNNISFPYSWKCTDPEV